MTDIINIGGIVRNTTKMNTQQGDMDEIVNLRRREGRLEPLCNNTEIWSNLQNNSFVTAQFSQLFIHTGKTYKHLLGIRIKELVTVGDSTMLRTIQPPYRVTYIGDIVGENISNIVEIDTGIYVTADKVSIHQIGNLLVLNDTSYVKYLLWKGGEYINTSVDTNGNQDDTFINPDGCIQLRVKPKTNNEDIPIIYISEGELGTSDNWFVYKPNSNRIGMSMIAQARKVAKEQGVLNGFTIAVTAFELYDGSYIYASRPILIPQPNDKGTRYTTSKTYELPADGNHTVEEIIQSANNGGVSVTEMEYFQKQGIAANKPFTYNDNVKAMNLFVPETKISGVDEAVVRDRVYECPEIAEKYPNGYKMNLANGQLTRCELEEGVVNSDSESTTNGGSSVFFRMPLFSKDKEETDKLIGTEHEGKIVPYHFNTYFFQKLSKKDMRFDAYNYQHNYATLRCCSCSEIVTPESYFKNIHGNRNDNTRFQWGIDSFNPPNCFSIMGAKYGGNRNLCRFAPDKKTSTDKYAAYGVVFGQTIQINIKDSAQDSLKDIIKNVCVFLSSEIYMGDEEGNTGLSAPIYNMYRRGSGHGDMGYDECGATVYTKPKENKKIREELEKTSAFYKIYSTPYETTTRNSWKDIELDKILNTLEEQETLPVDSSVQRNGILAECSYIYNGRLHLGNIRENIFHGFPISYFEIPEQWDMIARSDKSIAPVTIKSNNSKHWWYIYDSKVYKVTFNGVVYDSTYNSEGISCFQIPEIVTIDGEEESIINEYNILNTDVDILDDNNNVLVSANSYYICKSTYDSEDNETISYYVCEELPYESEDFAMWAQKSSNYMSGKIALYDSKSIVDKYVNSRVFRDYHVCAAWDRDSENINNIKFVYIVTDIDDSDGNIRVARIERARNDNKYYPLNPIISYPNSRAYMMRIGYVKNDGTCFEHCFKLSPFTAVSCSQFISDDIKPIKWWNSIQSDVCDLGGITDGKIIFDRTFGADSDLRHFTRTFNVSDTNGFIDGYSIIEVNSTTYRPNIVKVSATETPMYFPAVNTYQVGNAEIVGICANTVGLSTGQWGDAPLYVFCTDGVYAMFVDSSGALVYPNSRPISREVCNNRRSIMPIDGAVVFSSNRGLQMLSGSECNEISKQIEGKICLFSDNDSSDYLKPFDILLNHSAWLSIPDIPTNEEAKEFLSGAECGWNYDNRELWVSNPDKPYSYVFSEGLWSKVSKQIKYFINDYPKTYYVMEQSVPNGSSEFPIQRVYDIAKDDNVPTDCMFITKPIVINGESAKTFTKAWIYGDFNVVPNAEHLIERLKHKASILVYGSEDGDKFGLIGIGGIKGRTRNVIAKTHRMTMRYIKIAFVGRLYPNSRLECIAIEQHEAWRDSNKPR